MQLKEVGTLMNRLSCSLCNELPTGQHSSFAICIQRPAAYAICRACVSRCRLHARGGLTLWNPINYLRPIYIHCTHNFWHFREELASFLFLSCFMWLTKTGLMTDKKHSCVSSRLYNWPGAVLAPLLKYIWRRIFVVLSDLLWLQLCV